jgi:hypothetical protein
MPDIKRPKARSLHALQPIVVAALGLGLAYLATLAVFALAFERPSAIGWLGYGIVAAVVLTVTMAVGQFLTRSRMR